MSFSSMSIRDRWLLIAFGSVIAFLLLGVMWFMGVSESWMKSQKGYNNAHKKRLREDKLIAEEQKWIDAYEAEKEKMPIFPENEDVDTYWLRKIASIAETNYISIPGRQAGEEVQVGDVFERMIDVRNFEGALESLVKCGYELQHAESAMFDIRSINISPNAKNKGFLKGSFTLACAYMRDPDAESPSALKDEKKSKESSNDKE
jgi:hypothetical protein